MRDEPNEGLKCRNIRSSDTTKGVGSSRQQDGGPTWAPWTPQSLAQAFSTVSLNQPSPSDWVFDSGASSHVAANPGIVTPTPSSFPTSIVVGNGATLPVVGTGCSTLPGPFRLNNRSSDTIKGVGSSRQQDGDHGSRNPQRSV